MCSMRKFNISGNNNELSNVRGRSKVAYWKIVILSVLFLFGVCGIAITWFTNIYHQYILQTLTLGNGTKLHVAWQKPPVQPQICVHIFNYTNAKEYFSDENKMRPVVKLQVQDVGPYCFRETIQKSHIKFANNGTRLSYRAEYKHIFDNKTSNGTLDDIVYVPNVLILTAYKKVSDLPAFLQFVKYFLHNSDIIINKTVSEYLFGYEDSTISSISSLSNLFGENRGNLQFGVLKKRVGLSEDTVVINTGDDNLDETGQVVEVNNITKFDAWESDECNRVTGSDGMFFRRSLVQSLQPIALFNKDLCRALPFEFNETNLLPGGDYTVFRYRLKSDIFEPNKPENMCFFNHANMSRYGVLRLSSCPAVVGAPVVLSRPHLSNSNANMDADGNSIIEGLEPNLADYDSRIDVFPLIGLTVRTLVRLQMNIAVANPEDDSSLRPLVDNTILPISWIEVNSGEKVPEKISELLYFLSYTVKRIELALRLTFALLTFSVAFILWRMIFSRPSKKKIDLDSKPQQNWFSHLRATINIL